MTSNNYFRHDAGAARTGFNDPLFCVFSVVIVVQVNDAKKNLALIGDSPFKNCYHGSAGNATYGWRGQLRLRANRCP